MKLKIIFYLLVFFFCGAAIGTWIGQKTVNDAKTIGCRPATEGEVDLYYTDVLKISDTQKKQLMGIEKEYQVKRDLFTDRMYRANLKLADVIEKEGYESDKIGPLVGEIHSAMGGLQTLSLTHLAAVEKLLEPEQATLLKQSAVARLRQNR